MQKFWMVIGEFKAHPTMRHYSLSEAKSEAERLTRKEGGCFAVLQAIGYCEHKPAPIKWAKCEPSKDVPF